MSVVLATAGYDHIIRFWEAPTGVCVRMIKFGDSQINRLEITPDKQFIAAAGNPYIRLYEIQQQSQSQQQAGNRTISNNTRTGASDEKNAQDPAVLTLEGHTGNVTSLGFQRDEGRFLYSGSEDGTLKVWDLNSPYYSRSYNVGAPVNSVCLRTDRDELITGDQNGFVKIWDLGGSGSNGGLIHSVNPSASSSGFESLTQPSTTTTASTDPSVKIDDASTAVPEDGPDDKTTATRDTTRRQIRRNHKPYAQQSYHRYTNAVVPIQAVDISADSRTLVALTNRGTVYVWDPSRNMNHSWLKGLPDTPQGDPIDQTTTHTAPTTESDGYLQPVIKFRAHTEQPGIYCLHGRIAPDCRHLVTTASDGTAKLWDTTTWELSQSLIQHPPVVPTSNDRNQRGLNQHNNTTNQSPVLSKWVWDAAFCADSSYLVTASSDRIARLWNLRTGQIALQYHGHLSAVTCVALNDSSVE
jgi:target of rapamycin complex subunit LST8